MTLLADWKQVSDGVYVRPTDHSTGVVSIRHSDIEELKIAARESKRKRARICAHLDNSSPLHQMILVIQKESYVRPHRHHDKVESFHMIEGEMDVVLFSEDGKLQETIHLSGSPTTTQGTGGAMFYRLDKPYYHTILIHSPYVVFQEITQGPFELAKSDHADWAPAETDLEQSRIWMEKIKEDSQRAKSKSK